MIPTIRSESNSRSKPIWSTPNHHLDLSNLKSKFSEVAQVTDAQMAQLSDLFTRYAEARTSENAGAVMNWVQESIPNVDQSTYRNLQNIIVATRDGWTERQKELVDLVRVYNTALDRMPGGLLLKFFGFERKKAIIVITTDTKRAFETGTDEPAVLFAPKNQQPEKK